MSYALNTSKGTVETTAWGWSIVDTEWDLTVRVTGRQDGQFAWGVMLTEIDGNVKVETGLSSLHRTSGDLREAARNLTREWIEPLRIRVDFDIEN